MSDLMLGLGQMLAVVVIVGGVSIALWQVWVLANKLCRMRDQESLAAPSEPHPHAGDSRSRQIVFAESRARRPSNGR